MQQFRHERCFLLGHQLLLVVERRHVGQLQQPSVPFRIQQRFGQPGLHALGQRLLTDCTVTLSVGNIDESLVDRTSSSLLTDAVDVVGLVSNIDDVDVDEVKTQLVQFSTNVVTDEFEERITVLVDLLDGQTSDGQTELTKDDFLSHSFDVVLRQVE